MSYIVETASIELPAQAETQDSQGWLLALLRGWGFILLSLHLAAFDLPEEWSWSLWPYTFFSAWLGWSLALLAGSLTIPGISQRVSQGLGRLWAAMPRWPGRQAWFIGAALASGLLFWLARLQHLRWGDAYLLSVALSYPDLALRVVYNWQAPLTVFLHQRLWQFVADPWLGWPVEHVYATTSILCGMIFVYLLLNFMSQMGRTASETAVLTGLLLSTGSMQLFFGYVENYTLVSLALVGSLYLAWHALQGKTQPVWPILVFSLANAFHPSTVFLWPGMLFLSGLCWRRGYITPLQGAPLSASSRTFLSLLLQTVLPPLAIGGAVFALMEGGGHGLSALTGVDRPGGGDGIWFVPLFETSTEWQRYTMFSAAHILDWLNIHLLISPFGLPILLFTLLALWRFGLSLFDSQTEKDYARFLALMALLYLLFTWLWNPDYGGRKDWDLFAPSAFVYTLLAGYLLVRAVSDQRRLQTGGLFMVSVSLLHLAAWVFTNTHTLPRD